MPIDYTDLTSLLAPAREPAPCGPNLEYDPTFLEIEHEARSQPAPEFGRRGSFVDALSPDWRRVSVLAKTLLAESKDLRTAIYLLRALVATEGLPGLARGLYVLSRLVCEYWKCLHPELEKDDPTWRLNILAALSDSDGLLKELRGAEVVSTRQHGPIAVSDVLTLQRAQFDLSHAREIDALRHRVVAVLAAQADWAFRTAVLDAGRWLDELREGLVRELGDEAVAPLRGLTEVVGELRRWLADLHTETAAGSTAATSAVWYSDVDPVPNDELPGNVTAGSYFKVYRPLAVRPGVWTSFLVYLHSGNDAVVDTDSARRLGRSPSTYVTDEEAARVTIARGAEIAVVPTISGCRFNPRRQSVEWLEDVQAVEFRLQVSPDVAGYTTGRRLQGHVRVYVGPLLVAEIPTSIMASNKIAFEEPVPIEAAVAQPFSRVFVSYSHDDARIVSLLHQTYELVRIEYLRDVTLLRAGDGWNARLLDKIDRADRFQLCWSAAASRSPYVEQEWRHALAIQSTKQNAFICPFYWQKPMPIPPAELADLHFAYFELGAS